eukprot:scaffold32022_cov62-Phaeocystis_antarctica.AAC.5
MINVDFTIKTTRTETYRTTRQHYQTIIHSVQAPEGGAGGGVRQDETRERLPSLGTLCRAAIPTRSAASHDGRIRRSALPSARLPKRWSRGGLEVAFRRDVRSVGLGLLT